MAGIAVDAVAVVGPSFVGSMVVADGGRVGTGSACGGTGEGTVGSRPAGTVGWNLGRGFPEGVQVLAGDGHGICCAFGGSGWAL